jgi:hypothetical protein
MVVDQVETWLVEYSTGVSLGDRETDGIGEALTEGTGGYFDARCVVGFGVTGCDGINLL